MTAPSPAEPAPAGRLRHAEPVMGTVVSLDIPAAAAAVLPRLLAWLHWVDAAFSPYRDDSDVSRLGRGEVTLAQCAPELTEVLGECARIGGLSDGYFSSAPGGRLDPSGLVKGWAVERAATMLSAAGFAGHCVNGGGDLQCSGEPRAGQPWRVAIADPLAPGGIAVVVAGRDFAVATSGPAERGAHIVNPHTGRPASGLASVTIVGPRLTAADGYATAAFAMGDAARAWAESLDDYAAFAVTAGGTAWQTSRFRAWLA